MEKFASGIRDEHLRSFWKQLKILNPRSGFRDVKIRIRDKPPGSTTLVYLCLTRFVCAQVGGKDHVHCLLPPLESLATVEETIVRDKVGG